MSKRRGVDEDPEEEVGAQGEEDGDAESQIKPGEQEDAGKHEEELDPRIQARHQTLIVTEVVQYFGLYSQHLSSLPVAILVLIQTLFSLCFQEELEHLNQASDEINKLELQLDVRKLFVLQSECLHSVITTSALTQCHGRAQ